MNCAEIARRFAEKRPGFIVVSFGEVGLPFYRVRLRAQVLERKPVPPMEEIVMLAIKMEVDERETLRELLGLDTPLFEGVLAELLRKEYIFVRGSGGADLELTEPGKQVLADAREIGPADLDMEVHFDSLVRRVVPSVAGLIEARRMDSIGLREVPPGGPRPPELADLAPDAVERIAMRYSRSHGAAADLLALKRVDRRTRVFRPAAILVYRAQERKEVQVAFVVDGEISAEHENAFSAARLTIKMGVRAAAMEDPASLFAAIYGRELKGALSEANDEATSGLLACFDHPKQLRHAVEHPRKRLLIISPRLTPEIVGADFLDSLRGRLVEGAEVHIGIGPERSNPKAAELERSALRPLEDLFHRFRNFRLKRFSRPGPALLAMDRDLAILTRFNWLSFEGDPDRNYVDERGILLRESDLVDELFANQIARFD
jgi:hypothetical protein